MAAYRQGFFKPRNPKKYRGDPTRIVYRSSWELKCMQKFDEHPDVVEWSSEELIVPYMDVSSGKQRRYFPDFIVKKADGTTFMVEVKPEKETHPPALSKKKTTKYLREVLTWGTNSSKWSAAEAYCKRRGWIFMVMTEKDIFGAK
jgi:hypothetical protein